MGELYKHGTNGSRVSLKFLDTSWDIKVKIRGEMCYLGKGWREFVGVVGLREGDYLVAFKEKDTENNMLRVCIYSEEDNRRDLKSSMVLSTKLNFPVQIKMGRFHN